jgi:hypothetical protein
MSDLAPPAADSPLTVSPDEPRTLPEAVERE